MLVAAVRRDGLLDELKWGADGDDAFFWQPCQLRLGHGEQPACLCEHERDELLDFQSDLDDDGLHNDPGLTVVVVRRTVYSTLMATKTERLNLRLTPGQDAILRRAAEARGESTSDYVLRHAVEAAEMDLADRRVFIVDDAAWTELQALVSAPPRLPPQMNELLSSSSVLERS